ncbi:hypothetical protein ACFSSC_07390 [Corynebacterium mendelii]|uniref:Uncharacterized protein n=1 Tax=Corynebacterium mendelii TaxID=2765362 RepID=A0A939E0R9_9CORY|nr:hypothetical protein [Corynebacterium mendelii]MBN9644845.1 hypothetical protein [Corynebacterium mendelii]
MKLFDRELARIDALMDDEYQQAMYYRSMAINTQVQTLAVYVTAAVVTWFVPESVPLIVIVVLAPLAGSLAGNQWLKQHTARPKVQAKHYSPVLIAAAVVVVAFWMVGMFRANPTDSFGGGLLVGSIAGIVGVLLLAPYITARNNRKDTARLNSRLDD